MGFNELATATAPAFITALGQTLPVTLYGVSAFTIDAIYNHGGEMMDRLSGEVVIVKPSLTLSKTQADLLSKEHTITTEDGDFRIFGGQIPDGFGFVQIELVKAKTGEF